MPEGRLLLAMQDGQAVGCAAYRQFAPNTCELRRLYVTDDGRSHGVGRRMLMRLVEEARVSYQYMILQVIPSMREAWTLFESLGFYMIEPYVDPHHEGVYCMALDLAPRNRLSSVT